MAKGPKIPETEKNIEDLYYEKMCPEKECDLKTRIRNLLFPDGTPDFEVSRDEITSGNTYILNVQFPYFRRWA